MSKRLFLAVSAVAASAMVAGGCAPTTPRLDSRFGESVRTVTAQQILNPDAGAKDVPEAMDGSAARKALMSLRCKPLSKLSAESVAFTPVRACSASAASKNTCLLARANSACPTPERTSQVASGASTSITTSRVPADEGGMWEATISRVRIEMVFFHI